MDEQQLIQRTKQFSLRIIKLVGALPNTVVGRAIAGQVVRAGTGVGANYRAACRGRSRAEFVAKLGTVEEEADESADWLELIVDGGLLKPQRVQSLQKEAEELRAITARSRISAARNGKRASTSSLDGSPIANRQSQIANPRCLATRSATSPKS